MAKKEKETNKKEVVFITQELKQKSTANEEYAKVKGFIFFVVIILVCVGLLAYINGNFVTKDYNEEETTTTTTTVAYDSSLITMNKLFSVDKKYYYVLFYDGSSKAEKDFVKEFSSSYKNENTPLYKVDMSNKMNSDYYDVNGEENTTPTSLEEIKITRTTLIKITKGKVVSYVTDKYEIAKTLKPEDE
jgi:hypothetical protein